MQSEIVNRLILAGQKMVETCPRCEGRGEILIIPAPPRDWVAGEWQTKNAPWRAALNELPSRMPHWLVGDRPEYLTPGHYPCGLCWELRVCLMEEEVSRNGGQG